MQRPPELVPIPEYLQKGSESSGKLLHFGKIPKKFGQHLAKIQEAIQQFVTKNYILENGAKECIV